MYFGISEVRFNGAGNVGQSSYVTSPAVKKNLWDGYFTGDNNVSNVSKPNTLDAMAQLNAANKTENTKEAEKKAKYSQKMTKMLKGLEKKNFLKWTEKHDAAINLLKTNSALVGLASTVMDRVSGIYEQQDYLMNKLSLSLGQNATADEMAAVCAEVESGIKQLEKDAQKISAGVLKSGSYSEAMMLIDDDKKKEKYEKLARKVVDGMPDAFKNKDDADAVASQVEDMEASQDAEGEGDEVSANGENETGDFLSPFLYDDNGELLINTFEKETDDVSESAETVSGEFAGNVDATDKSDKTDDTEEVSGSIDSGDAVDNTENEFAKVQEELKKDLKKQKEKTGKEINPVKNSEGKILKSLLLKG